MSELSVPQISIPESNNIILLLKFLMTMMDKIINRYSLLAEFPHEFDRRYLVFYYEEKDNIYERINMFESTGSPKKYCTMCKIVLQAIEYIHRVDNDEYESFQDGYVQPLDYKIICSNSSLAFLWYMYCLSKVYEDVDKQKLRRELLIAFDKSVKLVGLTGEELCVLYES